MKRFNIAITICAFLIVIAAVFLFRKTSTITTSGSPSNDNSTTAGNAGSQVNKNVFSTQNKEAFSQQTTGTSSGLSEEKQSLQNMTGTLAAFATSERTIDELMEYLKASKQEPVMAEDKNDYTGSMFVVRTNNPFPGTRYFHAQYFQDETGKKFVQHMSFEYKPGPQAMQDAVAAVQQSFKGLGKPQSQKGDFAMWELDHGYVVWIKKQSAEDLENNLINPSTDADIGTIRVAVEQNPHDDIDEHGH